MKQDEDSCAHHEHRLVLAHCSGSAGSRSLCQARSICSLHQAATISCCALTRAVCASRHSRSNCASRRASDNAQCNAAICFRSLTFCCISRRSSSEGTFTLACLECPHQIELWLAARRSLPLTDRPTATGCCRRTLASRIDTASSVLPWACSCQ